jgi:hypothetical protein
MESQKITMRPEGFCKICGKYGKLSKEHIPPQKAFNKGNYFVETLDDHNSTPTAIWRKQKKQGGSFSYVLCEDCNNRTGGWYGAEYIKLAEHCFNLTPPLNANQRIRVNLLRFYPLRAFKQALSIILASSDPDLNKLTGVTAPLVTNTGKANVSPNFNSVHKHLPEIQRLILNRELTGFPNSLQMYCYLTGGGGGRSSGYAQVSSRSTGDTVIFSEFAWNPLGWVLAFEGTPSAPLLDVTNWSEFSYDEEVTMQLDIPCLWIASRYPLDFATPSQIRLRRKKNSFFTDGEER